MYMEDTSQINKIVIKKKKRGKKKSPHSKSYNHFLKGNLPKTQVLPQTNNQKIVVVKKQKKAPEPKAKAPEPKAKAPEPKANKKPIRRSIKRSTKKHSKRITRRSRKLDKKHLKNRRISFRCYSKNKKKVEDVMRSTKTMNQTMLKEKLKEKGIDIKSNQTSLIRDMFIFSELGGIHIKKE